MRRLPANTSAILGVREEGQYPGTRYWDPTFAALGITAPGISVGHGGKQIEYIGLLTATGTFSTDFTQRTDLLVRFDSAGASPLPLLPGMVYRKAFRDAWIQSVSQSAGTRRALLAISQDYSDVLGPRSPTLGFPIVLPADSSGSAMAMMGGIDGNAIVVGSQLSRIGRTAQLASGNVVLPGAAGTETNLAAAFTLADGRTHLDAWTAYAALGAAQTLTLRLYVTLAGGSEFLYRTLTVPAGGTAGTARFVENLPALSTVRVSGAINSTAPDVTVRAQIDVSPESGQANASVNGQ